MFNILVGLNTKIVYGLHELQLNLIFDNKMYKVNRPIISNKFQFDILWIYSVNQTECMNSRMMYFE